MQEGVTPERKRTRYRKLNYEKCFEHAAKTYSTPVPKVHRLRLRRPCAATPQPTLRGALQTELLVQRESPQPLVRCPSYLSPGSHYRERPGGVRDASREFMMDRVKRLQERERQAALEALVVNFNRNHATRHEEQVQQDLDTRMQSLTCSIPSQTQNLAQQWVELHRQRSDIDSTDTLAVHTPKLLGAPRSPGVVGVPPPASEYARSHPTPLDTRLMGSSPQALVPPHAGKRRLIPLPCRAVNVPLLQLKESWDAGHQPADTKATLGDHVTEEGSETSAKRSLLPPPPGEKLKHIDHQVACMVLYSKCVPRSIHLHQMQSCLPPNHREQKLALKARKNPLSPSSTAKVDQRSNASSETSVLGEEETLQVKALMNRKCLRLDLPPLLAERFTVLSSVVTLAQASPERFRCLSSLAPLLRDPPPLVRKPAERRTEKRDVAGDREIKISLPVSPAPQSPRSRSPRSPRSPQTPRSPRSPTPPRSPRSPRTPTPPLSPTRETDDAPPPDEMSEDIGKEQPPPSSPSSSFPLPKSANTAPCSPMTATSDPPSFGVQQQELGKALQRTLSTPDESKQDKREKREKRRKVKKERRGSKSGAEEMYEDDWEQTGGVQGEEPCPATASEAVCGDRSPKGRKERRRSSRKKERADAGEDLEKVPEKKVKKEKRSKSSHSLPEADELICETMRQNRDSMDGSGGAKVAKEKKRKKERRRSTSLSKEVSAEDPFVTEGSFFDPPPHAAESRDGVEKKRKKEKRGREDRLASAEDPFGGSGSFAAVSVSGEDKVEGKGKKRKKEKKEKHREQDEGGDGEEVKERKEKKGRRKEKEVDWPEGDSREVGSTKEGKAKKGKKRRKGSEESEDAAA